MREAVILQNYVVFIYLIFTFIFIRVMLLSYCLRILYTHRTLPYVFSKVFRVNYISSYSLLYFCFYAPPH